MVLKGGWYLNLQFFVVLLKQLCFAKHLALTHSQVLSATLKHIFFNKLLICKFYILICQTFILYFVIIIIIIIIYSFF